MLQIKFLFATRLLGMLLCILFHSFHIAFSDMDSMGWNEPICETIDGKKICSDDLDRSKLQDIENSIHFIFDPQYDTIPYFQNDPDYDKSRRLEKALQLTKAGYDDALDMHSEQALSLHTKIREHVVNLLLSYLRNSDTQLQIQTVSYIKFFDEDVNEEAFPTLAKIVYTGEVNILYEKILEDSNYQRALREGSDSSKDN